MKRLHVERATNWHVIGRGVRRLEIFRKPADYRTFLAGFARAASKHPAKALAYALMTNHYHLLVQGPSEALSNLMRDTNREYARYFNDAYELSGRLLEGPYLAFPATSAGWTFRVIRYIHLNPVKAGLCGKARDWEWSSARAYLGGATPAWLDAATGLAIVGGSRRHGADLDAWSAEVKRRPADEDRALREERLIWAQESARRIAADPAFVRPGPSPERIVAAHLAVEGRMVDLETAARHLKYRSPQSLASALHQFRASLARNRALTSALGSAVRGG